MILTPEVVRVLELKAKHADTWRDMPDEFLLDQATEEMAELVLALHGKHEHDPETEMRQLAAIILNWLEMRNQTVTYLPYLPDHVHVELIPGWIANVAPDISAESLAALRELAVAAEKQFTASENPAAAK